MEDDSDKGASPADAAAPRGEETSEAWAERMVAGSRHLLHVGSCVAGVAAKYFAPGSYTPPAGAGGNGEPVKGPVLQLDNGNAFVANKDGFFELTDVEANYYTSVAQAVAYVSKESVQAGRAHGIDANRAIDLIAFALSGQSRRLARG